MDGDKVAGSTCSRKQVSGSRHATIDGAILTTKGTGGDGYRCVCGGCCDGSECRDVSTLTPSDMADKNKGKEK